MDIVFLVGVNIESLNFVLAEFEGIIAVNSVVEGVGVRDGNLLIFVRS